MTTFTARDRHILHHVQRYRLTTRDVLKRLFFSQAGESAVSKVLARLVADGALCGCRLGNGFGYYVLGRQGMDAVGATAASGRPFSEQTLPVAFGFLAFCITSGVRRLTADEFRRAFPLLCRDRMKAGSYYVDARSTPHRLGTVLVDRGNPPKLILHKLQRLSAQQYRAPAFAELIQTGRFCVTILTAWPLKQRLLDSAIRLAFRGPLRVEVATVPELQAFYRRI
jgi:hypothetical protein